MEVLWDSAVKLNEFCLSASARLWNPQESPFSSVYLGVLPVNDFQASCTPQ